MAYDTSDIMKLKMAKAEKRMHRELLQEAKRPELISEYQGERLAKLWEQIELAKRNTWPSSLELNV